MQTQHMSNAELVTSLEANLKTERREVVSFIKMLAAVDSRKLYAELGHPSLFAFCTERLGLSESCTQKRIQVCRLFARLPVVLEELESGSLHLTALSILAPHLTDDNAAVLMASAVGKTQDQLRAMLASKIVGPQKKDQMRVVWVQQALPVKERSPEPQPLFLEPQLLPSEPQPLFPAPHALVPQALVLETACCKSHKMPAEKTEPEMAAPELDVGGPVVVERAQVSFQCPAALLEKIKRCQDLLRHKHPAAKLEDVFEELIEDFLDKKDPQRKIAKEELKKTLSEQNVTSEQKTETIGENKGLSRYVPAAVKHAALKRAQHRCTYESQGQRCKATTFLEFDHLIPVARGGQATANNIQILCRAHNQMKARMQFGKDFMRAVERNYKTRSSTQRSAS